MSPESYFPSEFKADYSVFERHNGGSGCGWAFAPLFDHRVRQDYKNLPSFICCVYSLNLIHQGTYVYFPQDYARWCQVAEKFPAISACNHVHGGLRVPGDLFRLADDPSYFAYPEPINIPQALKEHFVRYFFENYLAELCTAGTFDGLRPAELMGRLQRDEDCRELALIVGSVN